MKKVVVMLILLALSVAPAVNAAEEKVLAKVSDKQITMADLERMLGYYDPERRKMLEQNPQFKVTILQRIVQGMVISKMARDQGYTKRPEVMEQLDMLTNDFLMTEYIKKEVIGKIDVSAEDIDAYYKTHQEEFRTPEMVKARHILVKVDKTAPEEAKKAAKEKAEGLLKRLKGGEDFAKIAAEFSDDPGSKAKGGDLGFFAKGRMVPEFEKAAFSLKPGELSDVVETPFGFHIIKVDEKKESTLEPLDKVKDKIREKISADRRKAKIEEFVKKAMDDAGVVMDTELLAPTKK